MAKIIKNTDPTGYQPYEHAPLDPALLQDSGENNSEMTPEMHVAAILQEARAQAEQKIQEAYEEGFRRGEEAGRQEYWLQVEQSAQALKRAALEVEAAKQQLMEDFERELLEVGRKVVERVLLREALADERAILNVIRAALNHLSEKRKLVLRLNPADAAVLRRERKELLEQFAGIEQFEIIEDGNISQGGCTIETESAFIDARLEAQLNRILDAIWEIPSESPSAS